MKSKANGILMIGGMVVAWSIYYAISKVIVGATGSAFLAGFLLRSAAFVFLTIQLIAEGSLSMVFKQGKAVWFLILIGIFGFTQDICANLGYAGGNLSTGTALLKTDILMTNLVSVIIYRKKLFASDWAGTFIMLFGVLLVLGVDFKAMSFNWSDLFFILSAAALTANAFVVKAAQEKHGVTSSMASYYNNFIVMSCSLTGAAVGGAIQPANFGTISGFWPLVLLGGLAQTGIYFFYYNNLKNYEVWVVKLYLLLMPILSCFIGIFFLGETLTLLKILGIFIVLAGAAIILLRGKINHITD